MNTLSIISTILGIILSFTSVITLIFAKINGGKALKEGMKALLRSEIEKLYYANIENKTLREYERKSLDSLFAAYHDGLKGNSFVCDIYAEMREWEVIRWGGVNKK